MSLDLNRYSSLPFQIWNSLCQHPRSDSPCRESNKKTQPSWQKINKQCTGKASFFLKTVVFQADSIQQCKSSRNQSIKHTAQVQDLDNQGLRGLRCLKACICQEVRTQIKQPRKHECVLSTTTECLSSYPSIQLPPPFPTFLKTYFEYNRNTYCITPTFIRSNNGQHQLSYFIVMIRTFMCLIFLSHLA